MTSTSTTYDFKDLRTRKLELVERLIKEDKLTLSEGLLLLEKEVEYIQAPSPVPFQAPIVPFYTTCKTSDPLMVTANYPNTLTTT